jgi:general secretion pathway protein A
MYTEFYKLKSKPFNLTPSSRSLYLGDIHKEALALLTYGVIDRKGFILLTGEVGTGKTTMVHALLNNLGKEILYVYLSNPLFSTIDFMNYLAFSAFKQKMDFKNKTDFLISFEAFLKKQLKDRKNFVLIIDEAQKLSFELLEEIRLLSNLETSEEKLMNIFLVGQPELNDLLNQARCRPLLQRISIRYHMKALDEAASLEYISIKLKLAGAEKPDNVIPRNVSRAIFRYSNGYPRMINILADNVLLLGYARGNRHITQAMVKECHDDLQLEGSVFDAGKQKAVMEKRKGLWARISNFRWAAL